MKDCKDIKEFLKDLMRLEDAMKPYKPEYLGMRSEEQEVEQICEYCVEKCHREDPCEKVYDRLEEKQKVLSGANRIIDGLSLPMPKGRGFLRSLILSFHLHEQASLFSRAWPVRPYCIAPKGTQHYFF